MDDVTLKRLNKKQEEVRQSKNKLDGLEYQKAELIKRKEDPEGKYTVHIEKNRHALLLPTECADQVMEVCLPILEMLIENAEVEYELKKTEFEAL